MFVTYCDGDGNETLAILIDRTEDGTRGSVTLLNPDGTTQTMHYVPFDGQQVEGGAHLHETPPDKFTPGGGNPPANDGTTTSETPAETPPEETPPDTYTVGV